MNKFLKSLCLFVLMVVTMTGCRDDAELSDQGAPGNPEKEVIGTYNGVWYVTLDDVTTEYPGTVTLTDEGQYAASAHIECPDKNLDATVMVNVMKQNPNIRFYNEIPSNNLGAAFAGLITPQGNMGMDFILIIREGRKSFTYNYSFDGKR